MTSTASQDAPHVFCTRCGSHLEGGRCPRCDLDRFCTRCGNELERPGAACARCRDAQRPEDPQRALAAARVRQSSRWRLAWLGLFVLVVSAINFYGQYGVDLTPEEDELPYVYSWVTAIGGVISYAVLFGVVFALAAGLPKREVFALRRPRSWSRAVGMIAGAVVLMAVVGAVVEIFLSPGEEQGVTPDRWVPGHTGAYLVNLLVIAGLAPLVEELWFRGLGISLLARFGEWAAILVTAVAFAVIHGLLSGLPIFFAFGVALGFLRTRLDSVYPAIVLHAIFNAFAILSVFLA